MKMYIQPISNTELTEYLALPDLTQNDNHALGMLYQQIVETIRAAHPQSDVRVYRRSPIVSVTDNYDRLLIAQDNISRSSTYTHYVDEDHVLQTHTSAQIPQILRELAHDATWDDVVILVPGLAYRRDVSDKKHVSQVHMLDVWRVVRGSLESLNHDDLLGLVKTVAQTAAPGWKLRIENSPHPYTDGGIEVNATDSDRDIEILECGLIKPQILREAGLDPSTHNGWALGMGLDRLVMTLKDIPDVRYLRSANPRIAAQMHDLALYREVSLQPAIRRDMSYSVPLTYVEEDISADIRAGLGKYVDALESVEILNETPYGSLPATVKERLGIAETQKNILVRITLRHLERTITNKEADDIYATVYKHINYGTGGYL
ncbi:hypothetical protein KA047_00260 [Candidatus Saccharibacteria bacterium]|nr:hypothetical protein [Candidatus Saccharibacteria bacterium]